MCGLESIVVARYKTAGIQDGKSAQWEKQEHPRGTDSGIGSPASGSNA